MSDQLLTVAALRTTVEAELIRGKLETAGIASVLLEPEAQPEGAAAARVQVQVSPPDFEKAMQLLFPIPQRARPAKIDRPNWKCPKCGEQVMAQFPACWKCGTTREGTPPPSISFPSASAAGTAPPSGLPPLSPGAAPSAARPVPQLPPRPPALNPAVNAPASPPLHAPPRISMPASGAPSPLEIPPIPPVTAAAEASRPATNGESPPLKPATLPAGRTRTAEEDGLSIVVPAWDAATGKKGRSTAGKSPTDADDRAARRAWWTAVLGIVCPPVLIYSISVVLLLGLTGRALSSRGSRFFYGALVLNAAIIAAAFAWMGMHR
jgi:hypothetical protein